MHFRSLLLAGACALLLLPIAVLCQPSSLEFGAITTLDGLSQDIVTCIHRDRYGFLWIGTEDGLNLYDGYSLRVYKHSADDSTTISDNWILGMCDYGEEDLLVATMHGLSVYRRSGDSFRPAGGALAPFSDIAYRAPRRDSEGNYWVVLGTSAILRCAPDFSAIKRVDLIPPGVVAVIHTILVDSRGRIIVGADFGLFIFDDASAPPRKIALAELAGGERRQVDVYSVLEGDSGRLWIGTRSGLYEYDERDASLKFLPMDRIGTNAGSKRDYLFDLARDRQRRIWAAGFGGLYCYDPATGRSMSYRNLRGSPADPTPPRLYAVYIDPAEMLWVGSWRGGLWKTNLHDAQFGLLRSSQNLPFAGGGSSIAAVYEDPDGRVWFGDANHGITIVDGRTNAYRHVTSDPGSQPAISGDNISAIAGDSAGNVWIAASQNVIDWYNIRTGALRRLRLPATLGNQVSILALSCDRSGGLWIGTEAAGVYRYDLRAGTFSVIGRTASAIRSYQVTSAWSFLVDRAGGVWIGGWTFNSSLHHVDARTGEVTSHSQTALQAVRSMLENPDGSIWTGSWGNGLALFDPASGKLTRYLDRDGLPSNYVKGLLRDDRGNLWISTERGLSVFSPAAGTFRNYDVSDGLQGNFFYSGSCLRTKGGKFYFGGTAGVNGFYPDGIRAADYTAPVLLTGLRVIGEKESYVRSPGPRGSVEVSYLDNVLGFDFVSLDFRAPARNRYAYMLEGFDGGWIEAGTRRFASYTHLDPGEYVFKVKGTNSDGVWSPQPAALRIVVIPVYYQTWWFRGLAVLGVAALLLMLYRYRVSKLLELERTRALIATDLHDDIGTSLTNIALFSDLAKRDLGGGSESALRRLEMISQTSRSLLDAMNDIVWSIKPENDGLEQTILRMEDYAVAILAENSIDLHVQVPERLRSLKLPMTVRRNLFLVFKESIGNILKHAAASTVDVTIEHAEAQGRGHGIRLQIADNGRGFAPDPAGRGNGLRNMERRIAALGGRVAVSSAPGAGTVVDIWFPLNSPI